MHITVQMQKIIAHEVAFVDKRTWIVFDWDICRATIISFPASETLCWSDFKAARAKIVLNQAIGSRDWSSVNTDI